MSVFDDVSGIGFRFLYRFFALWFSIAVVITEVLRF